VSAARGDRRRLLLLFAISLVLRLGGVGVALLMDVHPVNDEWGYSHRAHGWANVYRDLLAGGPPAPGHWDQAYEDGFQPPLHPMALGLANLTGVDAGVAGRLLNALLTALATPMVFLLARRVVDRPAATAAAGLHLIYPTFTFFAHSLWAEPLFILLLLCAAERALAARAAAGRRRLVLAAAVGACAGLLCLTRTAGLSFMLVLPLAFLGPLRSWPVRYGPAALMLAASVVVIAPWQAALQREEGRFVLLATSSGLNLAMGNNPHVGPGCGSTWTDAAANARLRDDLERFARARGEPAERVGAAYALDQLHADPAEAIRRAGDRLRLVWSADLFPVRQVVQAVCRPVPNVLAGLHWLVYFLSYLAMMSLIVRGLLTLRGNEDRHLLTLVAAAGMIGPALSVGFSRLHLPMMVLLLPMAGAAWSERREAVPNARRALMALSMGLVAWLATSSLQPVIERQLAPSVWYRPLVRFVAGAFGAECAFADQVLVMVDEDGPAEVGIVPNHLRTAVALAGGGAQTVHVFARDPGTRTRLVLQPRPGRTDVMIDPVSAAHGWRWRSLADEGLPGVRIRWQGGVPVVPVR